MSWTRADFPPGFVFGAATSAYQIEGHAFGGADASHWGSFAATPGNVAGAEDGARACDHYHRWPEDLDLLKALGVDAYRFSASWARVMPEGTGQPNAQGLDFYDRLVDGMLERGLKPALTLYHWDLPQALADKGGWRNRDIAGWFGDYTRVLCDRIGDRIWSAAPINEPWCVTWLSHFLGHHAPGLRDIRATARAMHHVLLAQGTALGVMRSLGMGNLGSVLNMEWVDVADDSPESAAAAARQDAIYNRFFVEGMLKGAYPAEVLDGLEPHLPPGWHDDFPTINAPIDWLGLNYYTRSRIAAAPGPWPALRAVPGPLPKTQMGWEIHPQGLLNFLRRLRDLAPGLPLYVTENGMANADTLRDGACDDPDRLAFVDAHLFACRQAIAEGVDLRGYFAWSLMDNFEWAFGYEKRFGLVHVDFDTLTRTPKSSFHALARRLQA